MADLKSWDSIANDPAFQALPAQKQLQVRKEYSAAGGTPEESATSKYITPVVNVAQGAGASAAHGVSQAAGGLTEMLGNAVGSNGIAEAGKSLQNNADTVYAQNTRNIKNSASGQVGMKYGEIAADVAGTIAAPEIMIPALAAKATGRSYSEQKEGDKSIGKALTVGAVNAAANTILPSVGGKLIAPIARLGEGSGGVISNAITGTAKEAAIGAGAGSATGASEAWAKGDDALEGAKQGAEMGAVFGGAIRGVHELPKVAGTIKDLPNALKGSNATPDAAVITKVSDQGKAVNEAVEPTAQAKAFNNAPEHNFVRSAELNKAYDVPVIPQSAKGNTAGHEVLGINPKQADNGLSAYSDATIGSKAGNSEAIVARTKAGSKAMDKAVFDSNQTANDAITAMKAKVKFEYNNNKREGDDSSARAERFAGLDKFSSSMKAHNNALKTGDITTAERTAIELKNDFNNLHPTDKAEFLDAYKAPQHFTSGFDPIAHTHEYLGAKQQQEGILSSAPTSNKQGFSLNPINLIAGAKKAAISETFGTVRNLQQRSAGKNAEAITNKISTNEPATQQQLDALTAMNHPAANTAGLTQREAATALRGGKPLPRAIDPTTGQPQPMPSYGVQARNEARNLELDKVRSRVVDPALKQQITLDNMRNPEHVKSVKQQDAVINYGKHKEAADLAAKATVARQNAQHETAVKEIDRWHKEDAPYIPYNHVREAIAKTANANGKNISAARVKSEALKSWSKMAGMKGTGNRAEFADFVARSPVDIKAQGNQLIQSAFSGGKIGSEQAKSLWTKLHDIEAAAHRANGHETLARGSEVAGNAKGKLIDQVKATNQQNDLSQVLHDTIKQSGENIPKSKINDFVDSHIEKVTKQGQPLSNVQHETARKEAEQAAKDFAANYNKRSTTENEEIVGGKSEELDKAKKAFEETGELSNTGKKAIEDQIIHDAEEAFRSGDIDKMKEHLDNAINHYYRNDSARVHTLSKFVEKVAEAKANIAKGMKPREALTVEDFDELAKAGNTHANGMKGKLALAITGKDYVRNDFLSRSERSELLAQRAKAGKKGALAGKKPRIKLKLRPQA